MRTPDQVRSEFKRKGISVTSWAMANGFPPSSVFEVLGGRNQGLRGRAHKIAVKLGLKDGDFVSDHDIAEAI